MRPLLCLLLALPGCAGTLSCAPGLTPSVALSAYFGLRIGEAGMVSPAQWGAFLERELQSRFPDGYTVFDASGSWRNQAGRIEPNPSKVFLVLAPRSQAAEARARLQAAGAAYRAAFHQESVGLAEQPACTGGFF